MRYDTEMYLQRLATGTYDAETGNWNDDAMNEERVIGNVTNTGTDTLTLVYGNIKQNSLTIRLQGRHENIDYIRIGDKRYKIDMSRVLRRTQSLVVSEVQ